MGLRAARPGRAGGFDAREGRIRGGLKPLLTDGDVAPSAKSLGARLKASLGDAALNLFSDERENGDDVVATVVPFDGRLRDPKAQLWPTVLGVVRNAFVRSVIASFDDLPPPKAEEPEGPLEQARRALSKDSGPPRAQPRQRGGRGAKKPPREEEERR